MNYYPYSPANVQQPTNYYGPYYQNHYASQAQGEQTELSMTRQQPDLQQQVNQLTRQNQEQAAELTRQNEEIGRINNEINRINEEIRRINGEITRLNRNDELHTDRLNRLNQRVRMIERNLNIPVTPATDGF